MALPETFVGEPLDISSLSHHERRAIGLSCTDTIREIGVNGPITVEQIREVVDYAKESGVIGFDSETSGFDPFLERIILVQVGDPNRQYLIWWQRMTAEAKRYFLTEFYLNDAIAKVGFNLKFDMKMFVGQEGPEWRLARPVDCQIIEQNLHRGLTGDIGLTLKLTGMGETAKRWKGWALPKDEETRTGWELLTPGVWDTELRQRQRLYAADDVCVPVHVLYIQNEWIPRLGLQNSIKTDMEFLPELVDMEMRGLPFDWEQWQSLAEDNEKILAAAEAKLDELFDVTVTYSVDMDNNVVVTRDKNYGSPTEIRDLINEWMWERYGVDVIMTNAQFKRALIREGVNPEFLEKKLQQKLVPDPQNPEKNKQVGYPGKNDYLVGSAFVRSQWDNFKDKLSENAFVIAKCDSKTLKLMRILHEAPADDIDPTMPTTVGLPPELVDPLLTFREAITKAVRYGFNWEAMIHPVTGRVHTDTTQSAADTGRLTTRPNLQNIPADARYRACFVAPEGWDWIGSDYSQIEPRIIAELSNSRAYMRIFWSEFPGTKGFDYWCDEEVTEKLDLYGAIGANIGVLPKDAEKKSVAKLEENQPGRKKSKIAVLGLGYGTGKPKFRIQYMLDTKAYAPANESNELFDGFWGLAHEVKAKLDEFSALADPVKSKRRIYHPYLKKKLTYYETLGGLKRFFHPESPAWWTTGRNGPIQGTGADILKLAVIAIGKRFRKEGWEGGVILTAHDEILILCRPKDTPDVVKAVAKIMSAVGTKLCPHVPIVAEPSVTRCWTKD